MYLLEVRREESLWSFLLSAFDFRERGTFVLFLRDGWAIAPNGGGWHPCGDERAAQIRAGEDGTWHWHGHAVVCSVRCWAGRRWAGSWRGLCARFCAPWRPKGIPEVR